MKKSCLFFVIFGFLVFLLAGVSYGWQGRMAGMGDPYGLVQDESDFLIHPAKIANGKGINFYGGYRFNYTDVMKWNYTSTEFTPAGAFFWIWPYRGSGDEWKHNGLIGAAFPMGPGRMGLFFEYEGKRGDYDGDEDERSIATSWYHTYKLESDFDTFALRLLYGIPMGNFKLGGELQLAYRREKDETFINEDILTAGRLLHTNYPLGGSVPWVNLFPFMIPYDSKYWEVLLKGSLEGMIGPAKIALTMRGGFIFSGDNKYRAMDFQIPPGVITNSIDMDGDVKGWRMGGDFWLRYPLAENLSLPFLLKIEYQKKTRDGEGYGNAFGIFGDTEYKNRESVFQVEVGGGVDKELVKGTRIAAGIYYNYAQNKNNFVGKGNNGVNWIEADYSNYPDHQEHRVILKLSGEKEISPMVALRMGLNFFYGWVKEDFEYNRMLAINNTSLDGYHWGIGASLGGTVKFQRFSVEPFIGGGYQNMKLKGDGDISVYGPLGSVLEGDKTRKEWSIGGGFSIKFN